MIVHQIETPVECSLCGYKNYSDRVITSVEEKKVKKTAWKISWHSPFIWKEVWYELEYEIFQVIPYVKEGGSWDYSGENTNNMLRTMARRDYDLAKLWIKENGK